MAGAVTEEQKRRRSPDGGPCACPHGHAGASPRPRAETPAPVACAAAPLPVWSSMGLLLEATAGDPGDGDLNDPENDWSSAEDQRMKVVQ